MKLRWEDTVEERAKAIIECWIEDCINDLEHPVEMLHIQRYALIRQIEIGIYAQRTEYHIEQSDCDTNVGIET